MRKDYRAIANRLIDEGIQGGLSRTEACETAIKDAGKLYKALRRIKNEQSGVARAEALQKLRMHVTRKYMQDEKPRYIIHGGKCYFPVAYLNPEARDYLESTGDIEMAGRAFRLRMAGVPINSFSGHNLFYTCSPSILSDNP